MFVEIHSNLIFYYNYFYKIQKGKNNLCDFNFSSLNFSENKTIFQF